MLEHAGECEADVFSIQKQEIAAKTKYISELEDQVGDLVIDNTTISGHADTMAGLVSAILPEMKKVMFKLNEKGWLDLTVIAIESWRVRCDEALAAYRQWKEQK